MITLLIVEDMVDIFLTAKEKLEKAGFEVLNTTPTKTVSDAVQAITKLQPDLVVLDHRLENGEGVHVARKVKESKYKGSFVVHSNDWSYTDVKNKYAQLGIANGVKKHDYKNLIAEIRNMPVRNNVTLKTSQEFHEIPYETRHELFYDFLMNFTAIDLELQLLQEKLQNPELSQIQEKLFSSIEQLRDFVLKEE